MKSINKTTFAQREKLTQAKIRLDVAEFRQKTLLPMLNDEAYTEEQKLFLLTFLYSSSDKTKSIYYPR